MILPWVLGFAVFDAGPMVASMWYSATRWDGVSAAVFVGWANYADLLFDDPRFWQSLEVTLVYAVASIGLGVAVGLAIAILVAGERETEETLIRTTTEINRLLDDIYDRRVQ